MLKLSDFDYQLPPNLIAQTPVEPRDHSRLLRIQRSTQEISHHHFYDLPQFLRAGDVLVLNNTKVMPVRLFGHKTTGGQVEILLIKKVAHDSETETWETLTRPGLKPGQIVIFGENELTAEMIADRGYTRLLKLSAQGEELLRLLDKLGQLPTPPYITEFVGDPNRYQTIFAEHAGSAAAPTAGLHFTSSLLEQLQTQGIEICYVTLHVGLGTFLSVKTENILQHHMHHESYVVPTSTAQIVSAAKAEGRRIIPAGTTSLRTLEAAAEAISSIDNNFHLPEKSGETDLFIYPGYKFKLVDALITNFHLPKSTLLMLVSALVSAPQTDQNFTNFQDSLIGRAYKIAIANEYRFFSFGDAMLIE